MLKIIFSGWEPGHHHDVWKIHDGIEKQQYVVTL
jgi:hypothetical protein